MLQWGLREVGRSWVIFLSSFLFLRASSDLVMRWHALRDMHAQARPTLKPAQQQSGVGGGRAKWRRN